MKKKKKVIRKRMQPKGVWEDWEIYHNDVLKDSDILLFGLIKVLYFKNGYCSASNQTMADLRKRNIQIISRSLKRLEDLNYIYFEYKRRGCEIIERKIFISQEILNKLS